MKISPSIKTVLLAACLIIQACAPAARADSIPAVSVSAGFDVVSRYIWRGLDLGHTPSIQPGLSVTWKGLTAGAWGAYKIAGKGFMETDLFLSKTFNFVTVSIYDYYMFDADGDFNYFNYKDKTTEHAIEAQVFLDGGEKVPFNLLAAWMFYGADQSRSIYLEAQYEHKFSTLNLTAFAGYQPKGNLYAPDKGFVQLGCTVRKSIEVTDRFSLPVNLSLITNPSAGSTWLVAGITIQ